MFAARQQSSPATVLARSPARGNRADARAVSADRNWLRLATAVPVSRPGDAAEREADRVADAVSRGGSAPIAHAGLGVHRMCAACEDEQREGVVQTKPASGGAVAPPTVAPLAGGGQPLPDGVRGFFEPRLGADLAHVRLHAGADAAASAQAFNARAYAYGAHVVFGAGELRPDSHEGRRLLAHELAHVVQQGAGPARVQRSLQVDPARPTDPQDPLSRLAPAAFQSLAFSDMGGIVHSLCDQFNVDAGGNVVSSPARVCDDPDAVASGGKPLGCCCLCALTDSGTGPWTLHVTGIGGPRTVHRPGTPGGDFFLHPRSSDVEFGAWSAGGARETEDPVVVAGHELCGHGALIERGVHPLEVERVDTNVHDPTVRIENLIRTEQGLPGSPRGLATDPHRGESFARITIRKFPFNGTSTAGLPGPERDKIQLAKDFINANNTWVDLFGHSDPVGSASAKLSVSQARANNMRSVLSGGLRPVSASISKTFRNTGAAGTGTITVSGNRFTRIEGRSDLDAIPAATDEDQRRVDIVMPTRPAGTEVPIAGTPTAVAPVGPQSFGTFFARRFFGNACDRLLTRSAWF
jgi:hypothetical protein